MYWKPLLTLVVCIIGGILWARSERYKRMIPVVIAALPFLDVVFVQIPLIQQIYESLPAMTTTAGGCTIGLGDFAFGGFLIGVMARVCAGWVWWGKLQNIILIITTAWYGLFLANQAPGLMIPQTPFVALGALPFLFQRSQFWYSAPDDYPRDLYRSEVLQMNAGWKICTVLCMIASIVFLARL
jgi:hypothetical protein